MEGRDQKGQQQSLCDFPGLSCLSRVLTLTWPPWPWLLSKVRILATKQRSDKRTEVCWARGNPGAALVAKGCRRLNEEKQWKEWSGGKGKARVPEIPKLPECTWGNYLPVFPIGFYPAASAYACFYRNDPQGFEGQRGQQRPEGEEEVNLLLEDERMWLPAQGPPFLLSTAIPKTINPHPSISVSPALGRALGRG